ncbi:MAG: HEAT repeat domain-containing protein [Candidatus Hodarchaeota archaeon]
MDSKVTDDQKNQILDQILKEIDSPNVQERAACIKRLGRMNIQIEDIPILLHKKLEEALLDSAVDVRKEAIMTLAFLEGEVAIPILEPLLDDPTLSVRGNAIAALSYIGVHPPLEVVKKMIILLHAPEDEIRDRCARTLGRLKVHQARDPLLKLARDDSSPTVRGGAVAALGMLEQGDNQLKTEITQLLKSERSAPVISALRETLALIETQLSK